MYPTPILLALVPCTGSACSSQLLILDTFGTSVEIVGGPNYCMYSTTRNLRRIVPCDFSRTRQEPKKIQTASAAQHVQTKVHTSRLLLPATLDPHRPRNNTELDTHQAHRRSRSRDGPTPPSLPSKPNKPPIDSVLSSEPHTRTYALHIYLDPSFSSY